MDSNSCSFCFWNFLFYIFVFAKSVNWEENRELGVVRLHIFNSRISNSRKIPGPKKRELGGHTVVSIDLPKATASICELSSY